jgi:hypothetical protein
VGPELLLTFDRLLWQFRDSDISREDHFHPSFHGQRQLAEQAFDASSDFTDTTAPEVAPPPTAPRTRPAGTTPT